MKLRLASQFALVLLTLSVTPVWAEPIESEPLAPLNIKPAPGTTQQPPANSAYPTSGATGTSPYASTTLGGPQKMPVTPSVPATSAPDNGMSGASGTGTSAYDLGKPASTPSSSVYPAEKQQAGPATNAPTYPSTYKPSAVINNMNGVSPPDKMPPANIKFCDLKISFSSAGSGPDTRTSDRIKSYLDSNADKATYLRAPFGNKGEYSYCLTIEQHNNRSKLYTAVKKLLPANPVPGSGPVTISGEGFETVRSGQ